MFHTGGKEDALLQILSAHHALSQVFGLAGVLTTYALSYQPGPPLTGQLANPRAFSRDRTRDISLTRRVLWPTEL